MNIDQKDQNKMHARIRVRRRMETNGNAVEKDAEFEGIMTTEFIGAIIANVLGKVESMQPQ